MINPLFADENPDPAAVALWQVEHRQVTELLDRVEHVERAILEALGCPTDPAGIYAILNGEQPAPWPKRTAARDKKRAKVAMHALCWARKARGHLNPLNENANLAVESALIAGALAGDVVITAEDAALGAQAREIKQKAGRARGKKLAERASKHDATIKRYLQRYQSSDDAKDEYRSARAFIEARTGLPTRTIQRALKRLRAARAAKPRQ